MPDARGDRAVVLGGSMAGLLAARVLADAYAEVVIVERDELPHAATHRRGVPQSRHIHGLLARGQQALEELFDGLTAEMVDLGAPAGDMLEGIRAYFGGHRLQPDPSGLLALQASRPLLEAGLRARVRTLPSVEFMDRCDVAGLTTYRRWRPRHRRAGGAKARRQCGADRGSGRGRNRPRFTHAGLARDAGLPASAGGAGADRSRVCQPDLPARPRTARRRPGNPYRGDTRSSAWRSPRGDGGRPIPRHVVRPPRRLPADRPRGVHRLRRHPAIPRHQPSPARRGTARRTRPVPAPRQRASPLRAALAVSRGPPRDGRCRVHVQPDLRAGHERGGLAGTGLTRPPPSAPDHNRSDSFGRSVGSSTFPGARPPAAT